MQGMLTHRKRRWLAASALVIVSGLASCTQTTVPQASAPAASPVVSTASTAATQVQATSLPSAAPTPSVDASAVVVTQPTASAGEDLFVGSWDGIIERLDQLVPRLLLEQHVPGVSIALVRDGGVVWAGGYGVADRSTGTKVSADTVFQAASISKSVTAWGVMRLVEAGKIDLDAPVEQYLTRWHLPASRFDHRGVTIRRVLSHTAGLSLHGYPGIDPALPLPTLEQSLSGENGGAGDVRVFQEPGTAFSYSGGGYTLLQLAVEEVSGERFAEYMQRNVLEPLGMTHSSFEWPAQLVAEAATPYDSAERRLPNYRFTELAPAGLNTTAADLARFVAAGLAGPDGEPAGRGVLKPETIALMYTPQPNTEGDSYALGYQTTVYGAGIVGHSGASRGWRSFFGAAPVARQGVAFLTNSDNGRMLYKAILGQIKGQ